MPVPPRLCTVWRLTLCLSILCVTSLSAERRTASGAVNSDYTVRVIVERVIALDNLDTFGSADFYAYLTVDGESGRTPTLDNNDDIQPDWSYLAQVSADSTDVPIEIALWDEDDFPDLDDDLVDLQGGSGRSLVFTVHPQSCVISGDINGPCGVSLISSGTEDDRATIQLRVEVTELPDPYGIFLPFVIFDD